MIQQASISCRLLLMQAAKSVQMEPNTWQQGLSAHMHLQPQHSPVVAAAARCSSSQRKFNVCGCCSCPAMPWVQLACSSCLPAWRLHQQAAAQAC